MCAFDITNDNLKEQGLVNTAGGLTHPSQDPLLCVTGFVCDDALS